MTIAKLRSVSGAKHAKSLQGYLDNERAILSDSQYIADERNWYREMERTRAAYHHNTPYHVGGRNVVMYHQFLAFNPDECALNGHSGMTPQECMDYARKFVEQRFPNQEAYMVLHQEKCKEDGAERFAVHIAVNRTDIETGRRFHNTRPINTQRQIKERLDEEYNLEKVQTGKRNSKDHARQETDKEKDMKDKGKVPIKEQMRQSIDRAKSEAMRGKSEAERMEIYRAEIEKDGITMRESARSQDYTYSKKYEVIVKGEQQTRTVSARGLTLGDGRSKDEIEQNFQKNLNKEQAQERDLDLRIREESRNSEFHHAQEKEQVNQDQQKAEPPQQRPMTTMERIAASRADADRMNAERQQPQKRPLTARERIAASRADADRMNAERQQPISVRERMKAIHQEQPEPQQDRPMTARERIARTEQDQKRFNKERADRAKKENSKDKGSIDRGDR